MKRWAIALMVAALSLPPAGGVAATPTIIAAGDIADCLDTGDEATAALVETMAGEVVAIGDLTYPKAQLRYMQECYGPTWGRFASRTRPVAGNHDWDDPYLSGWRTYWSWGSRATWYAWAPAPGWRAYVLDSDCSFVGGCDVGSKQEAWLRADLAANPAACIVAFWHHPRFTSDSRGDHPETGPLYAALHEYGADLVLAGHDHRYERFRPMLPNGTVHPDGIRSFVVGTGGTHLSKLPAKRRAGSLKVLATLGVFRLTLGAGSWRFDFIGLDGTSLDGGGFSCS